MRLPYSLVVKDKLVGRVLEIKKRLNRKVIPFSDEFGIGRLSPFSKLDLLQYCRTCPGLAYMEEGDFRAPSKTVCQEARIIRDAKRG